MRQRFARPLQIGMRAAKRAGRALRGQHGLSERRDGQIVSTDRTMIRDHSCRPPDTPPRARRRALAKKRRRCGRLFIGEKATPRHRCRAPTRSRRRRTRRSTVSSTTGSRTAGTTLPPQARGVSADIVDVVTRLCSAVAPDTSASERRRGASCPQSSRTRLGSVISRPWPAPPSSPQWAIGYPRRQPLARFAHQPELGAQGDFRELAEMMAKNDGHIGL